MLNEQRKAHLKQASVQSFLKRKWLTFVNTIVSDKIRSLKLEVIEQIVVCIDKNHELSNMIEKSKDSIENIMDKHDKLKQELSSLFNLLVNLGSLHNADYEEQQISGNKNNPLYLIKKETLTDLKRIDFRPTPKQHKTEVSVALAVASNPTTPPDTLIELCKNPNVEIRKAVAANPAATSDILNVLSKDPSIDVREAVAKNKKAPASILDSLNDNIKL